MQVVGKGDEYYVYLLPADGFCHPVRRMFQAVIRGKTLCMIQVPGIDGGYAVLSSLGVEGFRIESRDKARTQHGNIHDTLAINRLLNIGPSEGKYNKVLLFERRHSLNISSKPGIIPREIVFSSPGPAGLYRVTGNSKMNQPLIRY
jgi:hypothetical protein